MVTTSASVSTAPRSMNRTAFRTGRGEWDRPKCIRSAPLIRSTDSASPSCPGDGLPLSYRPIGDAAGTCQVVPRLGVVR
jgi:hypothetical protein